jgi:hypothetical protein
MPEDKLDQFEYGSQARGMKNLKDSIPVPTGRWMVEERNIASRMLRHYIEDAVM